jgi:hypothetical protein
MVRLLFLVNKQSKYTFVGKDRYILGCSLFNYEKNKNNKRKFIESSFFLGSSYTLYSSEIETFRFPFINGKGFSHISYLIYNSEIIKKNVFW